MDFQKDGVSSTRVTNRPGGNSTFSLSWDEPQKQQPQRQQQQQQQQPQQFQQQQQQPQQVQNQQQQSQQQQTNQAHTSVKVHNPPGGRSQISFG